MKELADNVHHLQTQMTEVYQASEESVLHVSVKKRKWWLWVTAMYYIQL
jgi:hypothetical protein